MASKPAWLTSKPSQFDIVTCYFPEGLPKPSLTLRPSLVLSVLQNVETKQYACEVAFGTKNLKLMTRQHLDLIIQNAEHLRQLRLYRATRFDLDNIVTLPWDDEYFSCWGGHSSPVLSSLTEHYVKDYAYLMMRRSMAANQP